MSGSAVGALFAKSSTLVVGVEDDAATGCLRMYVGHRARGVYALVEDEDAKDELRRAWGGGRHVVTSVPPREVLYTESERP
jgi:hypothetical protein